MVINLSLQQKMSQQLVMTPQLQQAIKLLQLNHLELAQEVQREMEENPTLEEGPIQDNGLDDNDSGPSDFINATASADGQNDGLMGLGSNVSSESDSPDNRIASDLEKVMDVKTPEGSTPEPTQNEVERDIDWENYLDAHSYALPSTGSSAGGEDLPPIEATVSAPETLIDTLRLQAQMLELSENEFRILFLLVEEVNEEGYLASDAVEIVIDELEDFGVTADDVNNMIRELQEFEPIGVGSRNIRECLMRQAQNKPHFDDIALKMIDGFLPEIEKRHFQQIAKKLKVPLARVGEAMKALGQLEPRPGRAYSDKPHHYITPDIYVVKENGEWRISQNEDGLPKLRISNYYRNALRQAGGDAKSYIQDKLRGAAWLIRSIHMRQRTIYKVTESILKFQADFFEKSPTHLKPLILKDVAEDVEMHESTISRVTTNKYVHTPQGIFELKYFFNSSINRTDGDTIASESVRNRILELISSENPKKPLSDQRLVAMLVDFDINIARRTVAKYREMLHIPSSSKRKQVF